MGRKDTSEIRQISWQQVQHLWLYFNLLQLYNTIFGSSAYSEEEILIFAFTVPPKRLCGTQK